jgi:Protein of unknown function (DUF3298)
MRSRRTITIVMSLVLLLVVGVGYFAYANNLIPFLQTSTGTIASPDGSVELHIPDGVQLPGTHITFTSDPSAAQSLNLTARGISALGSPVNITVTNGRLAANRVLVTMKYNPLALSKGVTPTNLGMAVFDPNFDAWMPLGSLVDVQSHTVSAIAPHFSLFSVVFLDPAKRVVHIGGKVISTVINGTMTIEKWFGDLEDQLIVATVKDLFGIAPSLSCEPSSQDVIARTKSILNRLTACAEPSSGGDTTLRIRNGYGFPVRINTFPAGFTQRISDVFTNGSDILNLLRNVYYHFGRQAVLPGADLGSVTVTSAQKGISNLSLNLDALSVAEDVGLTALFLFEPAGKVSDTFGEAGLKAALETIFTVGRSTEEASSGAMAWTQRGFDILDCTNSSAHTLPDLSFSRENIDRLVEIGRSCISSVLEKFNLKSILVDILGSLKVIPSLVEATVAEALKKGLPEGVSPNTTSYSITVTRLIPLTHSLVPDPPFGQGFTTDGVYVQVSGIDGLEAVNAVLKDIIVQDQQKDREIRDFAEQCSRNATLHCSYSSGPYSTMSTDTPVISASSSVVSVLLSTDVEFGGVPNEGWVSATIFVENAQLITFADLFSDTSQALVALSQDARAELNATNDCVKGDDFDMDRGLDPTNPDNFQHFALSPSGLTIGFDRYQVGGGACGGPSVTIPWSQLHSFLSMGGRQIVSLLR